MQENPNSKTTFSWIPISNSIFVAHYRIGLPILSPFPLGMGEPDAMSGHSRQDCCYHNGRYIPGGHLSAFAKQSASLPAPGFHIQRIQRVSESYFTFINSTENALSLNHHLNDTGISQQSSAARCHQLIIPLPLRGREGRPPVVQLPVGHQARSLALHHDDGAGRHLPTGWSNRICPQKFNYGLQVLQGDTSGW